jgi:hypothetical protein
VNSKYFHKLASARRAHNHITHINITPDNPTDPPSSVTISHTPLILAEFTTYYRNLLGTPTADLLQPNLNSLYAEPDQDHLRSLVDPISMQEIKPTVFALPKDKASGPDGITIEFFQCYWEFISQDLLSQLAGLMAYQRSLHILDPKEKLLICSLGL